MTRIRNRLDSLRQQSGSKTTKQPEAPPLRKKLQRLTVRRRSPEQVHTRCTDEELAALLGGQLIADGLILVEDFVPAGTAHGDYLVGQDADKALPLFGHHGHEDDLLFLDAETTGLAGGTGTLVFLLGLGRLKSQGLILRQYFLTGFSGEKALLACAADFVRGVRTLVTFNGKSFDTPLLAGRYRLAGMADPFAELAHADLLHPTRRAFASRWDDCRLQTAERYLLAFSRVDDLPGSLVPEAWFGWVRWGTTHALPKIFEHNRWDLVSLATLLSALGNCYERPADSNADVLAIARHHLRRGDAQRAYDTLSENTARLGHDGLLEMARLRRREGDWQQAAAIWHDLAEQNHPEALEHLAKYYEHVVRDLVTATNFTARLRALQPADPRHRHRDARLQNKQSAAAARDSLTALASPPKKKDLKAYGGSSARSERSC